MFTDDPGWFSSYLQDLPVIYETLTPERIRAMRGDIDFLHRMKIALIERSFDLCGGNLLYADSDTFFIKDPGPVLDSMTPEKAFMHKPEYPFSDLCHCALPAGKPFLDFVRFIQDNKVRFADGSAFSVPLTYYSWNAGVMLFHQSHRKYIPDVYALTGQFYPATLNHASEQYAFSIVLNRHLVLQECFDLSYHYWHRVKKMIADQFLEKQFPRMAGLQNTEERLLLAKTWIRRLPVLFTTHYERHKDDAIQYFNEHRYGKACQKVFRAFLKRPTLDRQFIRDTLYHTKQYLKRVITARAGKKPNYE